MSATAMMGAGLSSRAVGGGSWGGSTIAPCAFQLDVQWILDIIDRVQSAISKVEQVARNVLTTAGEILGKLSGILTWFCWLPGGKFAVDFVKRMCWLIEKVVGVMAKIYNSVLEVMKHVLAPWEVRSAGQQIRDDLAPKCASFADMLHVGHLRSGSSWTGDAADLFRQTLGRQQEAGQDVANAAKAFGQKVQEIGADGVTTTVTFVTKLITTIGALIVAALAMVAAPPVSTAAGAAAAIGLVGAILSYIMVYVNAMMGIIRQSSELGNAASAIPGGQWPTARS